MYQIWVDQLACVSCGVCVELCMSAGVFATVEGQVRAVAPEECWLCGHCVAGCPNDAIVHSAFPLAGCPKLDGGALPSLEGLVTAFRERRSARVFKDKPVPREVVQELVDLARWVPSASNGQPVDWLAYDNPDLIADLSAGTVAALGRGADREAGASEEWSADLHRLAEQEARGEDPIFYLAPVVLLAHVPEDDEFGRDDSAYAAYNLMLGAERLGLGTCLIGYLTYALGQSPELRDRLALPPGRRVEVALILGYPKYRFQRLIPRRRMALTWNPDPRRLG